jgi:hypothetical protein
MKKLLLMLCLPAALFAQAQGDAVYADTLFFVRPSNATAYAAGDVVCAASDSGILSFSFIAGSTTARNAGSGYLVGGMMLVDTAITSGSFRLWLFRSSTGFSKIADNAAYVFPFNMARKYAVGYIDFTFTSQGIGSGSTCNMALSTSENVPLRRVPATGLYGVLTATSAVTLKHGGIIRLGLMVQNFGR